MPAKTLPLLNKDDIRIFKNELRTLDLGYFILFEVAINVPFLVSDLLTIKVKSMLKDNDRDSVIVSDTLYFQKKYIRFSPEIVNEIQSYLVQRRILWGDNCNDEYLFCSIKNNTLIKGSSFTKALYRIRKKYNIENIYGLSSLRKAYAVHLLSFLPIEDVAKLYDKDLATFRDYITYN